MDQQTHLSVDHPDDGEAQDGAEQDVLPVVVVVGGPAQGDGEGDEEEGQGQQQSPAGDWSGAVEGSQFAGEVEEDKAPGSK